MKTLQKLGFGFAIVIAMSAFATLVSAQTPTPPLSVKPIRDGVYWAAAGAEGNTGIIVGTDGVIAIDARWTTDSAKEMLAAIGNLTPKPLTHVILTHSDADHVNGLAAFPKGLTIIAQENCKKEMEESLTGRVPAPRDYLPTHTVGGKESLIVHGVRMQLLHWGPAHTNGDLVVFLPDQKIAFLGDIVASNQQYTTIHPEKNGSSAGWIQTMKGVLTLNADTFVAGHGELQSKVQLQARLELIEARRAKIQELVSQGKSLDEVKAALGDSEKTHVLPNGLVFPTFTEVLYNEVSKN